MDQNAPRSQNILTRDLSPRSDTPRDVQFIAWLAIISSALQILGSLALFGFSPVSAVVAISISIAWIIAAWYLMKLKLWAWILFEIVLLISIIQGGLGLWRINFEFSGNEINYLMVVVGLIFFGYLLSVKKKFS